MCRVPTAEWPERRRVCVPALVARHFVGTAGIAEPAQRRRAGGVLFRPGPRVIGRAAIDRLPTHARNGAFARAA